MYFGGIGLWFVLRGGEQVFVYIFLGKRFRKQGHTLSGIPSGWAAGDQSCESMLGTQTHKQGRDLSLLWLLASLRAGLPSLPLCLSPVPEPRQVEGLICSHTVFPAHLQDACLACWLRQAPNRCTCSSQHRGLGSVGFGEHSSHHSHSPFLCMTAVRLYLFPAFLSCWV